MRFKWVNKIKHRVWKKRRCIIFNLFIVVFAFSLNTISAAASSLEKINLSHQSREVFPQPLAPELPAVQGSQVIRVDWLLNYQLANPDSATMTWFDNQNIIYSVPSLEGNLDRLFEIINIHSKEKRSLGQGAEPVVSPDKQWIAFVRGKKEDRQLWIMDCKGQNLKQISHVKNGLYPSNYFIGYIWSPDSKQIVFLYKPNYNSDDADRITPPSQIELIDVASNQSTSLGSFETRIKNLSWIPHSQEILFIQERMGFEHKDDINYALISTLNIENKSMRTLAKFNGWQQSLSPKASPDGRLVAFVYDPESPLFNVTDSMGLIKNDGKTSHDAPEIVRLTQDIKFSSPVWAPQGDKIYAMRTYGAYSQIYSIELKTGQITQLSFGAKSVQDFSVSPDGSHLAWVDANIHGEEAIRIAQNNGDKIKTLLTLSNFSKEFSLSAVREIQWTSLDYPIPMRGLLLMPKNYQKGQRYPLIVDIHGGGRGASLFYKFGGGILTTSPLEWQVWTAKDYAVFLPEFRSSGAFGSLAITRDHLKNHELLLGDLRDINAGVDYLIAEGIADANRLAAVGFSAGARRVNLLTATSHQYKAIVSHDGWADDYIPAINDLTNTLFYSEMGGSPWEVPENYLKDSALVHARGATTPTLFLMGNPKLGGVDPYKTAFNLFELLKQQAIDSDYIYYPDEGHFFIKKENKKDSFERAIKWIDEHFNKS